MSGFKVLSVVALHFFVRASPPSRQSGMEALRAENAALRAEIEAIKQSATSQLPLSLAEYQRYGRQMVLDGFGLPGVLAL